MHLTYLTKYLLRLSEVLMKSGVLYYLWCGPDAITVDKWWQSFAPSYMTLAECPTKGRSLSV